MNELLDQLPATPAPFDAKAAGARLAALLQRQTRLSSTWTAIATVLGDETTRYTVLNERERGQLDALVRMLNAAIDRFNTAQAQRTGRSYTQLINAIAQL